MGEELRVAVVDSVDAGVGELTDGGLVEGFVPQGDVVEVSLPLAGVVKTPDVRRGVRMGADIGSYVLNYKLVLTSKYPSIT